MAITYGYFDSIGGDREYSAAQMSEYFDGLVSDGVYENVGGAMQVTAGTGMNVLVQSGRALIDCRWIKNTAAVTLPITAAHVTLNRYTAVFVRLDYSARTISIIAVNGTPAQKPNPPQPAHTDQLKDLCLAVIYVPAGSTQITQANIQDMRGTGLCGWVTGLIKQVNTSTLFAQWQDAFESYYREMTLQFDTWLQTLTQSLNVNTYIIEFSKTTKLPPLIQPTPIHLDMHGYGYDTSDIIHVYINGLLGEPGTDYILDTSNTMPTVTVMAIEPGTVVTISVLKSRIGFYALGTSEGDMLITSDNDAIEA